MTHPYRSTTHEESYVHIRQEPLPVEKLSIPHKRTFSEDIQAKTIFLRKESDGAWYAAEATCVAWDQFDRRIGRQVARRRYFRWKEDRVKFGVLRPKYSELCAAFVE